MNIRKNCGIIAIIASTLIGCASFIPLSAAATTTTVPRTISVAATTLTTSTPPSTTPKISKLKELLQKRRELRKLALQKKLAAKKANPIPSATPITSFDEYQVTSLTQDVYETLPKTVLKNTTFSQASIGKLFFNNIQLDETIPTGFFQHEIYTMSGKITTIPDTTTMFAFLNYQDATGKDQFINFETEAKNNTFSIPIYFTDEGSYLIGLVPGTKGKSKIQDINVLNLGTKNEDLSATNDANLHIVYDPDLDKSSINWTRNGDGIYRIAFEQGSEKVIYITRQNVSSLPIRYADFRKFKPGNISIKISILSITTEGSWKTAGSIIVPITYHGFRTIEKSAVQINGTVPSIMANQDTITIQGTALVNLENEAYITNTQGLTEKVTLQTNHPLTSSLPPAIAKGSTFTLSYKPKTSGRFIIEINDEDGSAALNIPVYIATGAPLIPDYIDLNSIMKVKAKTIDLAKDREYILGLINDTRTGLGKQKVTRNEPLDALAQKHADDMAAQNFFGHVNPDGATPEDRRKKDGIPTEVGENLAYSPSLLSAMQGLLRSPIHRANILTDTWTSVGIGITQDTKNGGLKLVQEFAPAALTSEKLIQLESDIFSRINNARNGSQISSLTEDTTLKDLAKTWSDHLAKTDEFGFTTKDGQSLQQLVENANLHSSMQMFVFSTNSANDIAARILEPSSSLEAKWVKIGLGVSVTPLGEIKITTLLSK